jgi:hypothetical protein
MLMILSPFHFDDISISKLCLEITRRTIEKNKNILDIVLLENG